MTKDILSPEYFDFLPALTEIETETEQNAVSVLPYPWMKRTLI